MSSLPTAELYGISAKETSAFSVTDGSILFFFHLVIGLLSEFPLPMIIALLTNPVFVHPLFSSLPCGTLPAGFDNVSPVLGAHLMSTLIHDVSSSLKKSIVFSSMD